MSKTSVFPKGLVVEGTVEGSGDLHVFGTIVGPVELEGELVLEAEGRIEGDVKATSMIIRGVLAGDAQAEKTVLVESTARMVGDARAERVQIRDGARFRGRVTMAAEPAAPVRRRRNRRVRAEKLPSQEPSVEVRDAQSQPRLSESQQTAKRVRVEQARSERPTAEKAVAVGKASDDSESSESRTEKRTVRAMQRPNARTVRKRRGVRRVDASASEKADAKASDADVGNSREERPSGKSRRKSSVGQARVTAALLGAATGKTKRPEREVSTKRPEREVSTKRAEREASSTAEIKATAVAEVQVRAESAKPPKGDEPSRKAGSSKAGGRRPPPPKMPTIGRSKARRKDHASS